MSTALPCDNDGVCMHCKTKPEPHTTLTCKTCVTPWHVNCLPTPPSSMSDAASWDCPDCSPDTTTATTTAAPAAEGGGLVAAIRAIEADTSLSDVEKARKRQELLSGTAAGSDVAGVKDDNEILGILGENIKCSFCMQLPDRPVTTPCGHNFCLKCFEKWVGQGKKTCAKCRESIPTLMAKQPRINASLVFAIRAARTQKPAAAAGGPRVFKFINNDDRPDEAFTTERAVKSGKANAKSGKIFVTIAPDHLGPITAEYDPVRNTGVLVGDSWTDRLACRQWGAHFPHVSGIAGQSKFGAQSVVLSGGYEDDEDHGEWFIYTGSGGRDLSGNKRTNKEQSSDQKFTGANESLRLSCRKGYPVRVVRSYKEKRSNYAPETGVRYEGIYRIEKCWLKLRQEGKDGKQHKVCRYLFVRCDNSPAPWTSDEHGDRPRPLPNVPELKQAIQLTERKESAHWDFDEVEGCWKWMKAAPLSQKIRGGGGGTSSRPKKNSKAKILKEFSCLLCHKTLTLPITTPCAHNFCKACLDGAFEGQKFTRERKTGGRQLRTQKTVMKCPSCPTDLSDFLQNAQVNRELMGVIESLMRKFEEDEKAEQTEESSDIVEDEDEEEGEEEEENEEEDGENNVPDNIEAEVIPEEKAVEAPKRGRKRKNAAVPTVPTGKTRGRKAQKAADDGNEAPKSPSSPVADDGNESPKSPSSPLHVRSDNELEA
ncbi:E3 ubiquitin-protein ligase ORTHRUS 2-like [Silene latifolia]|uniref:E3 ubiquitin-protein ligase ORTHRUS 2-like n=1 Tax=Silene latifolia TaxID=37657 RepID=UPI003D780449